MDLCGEAVVHKTFGAGHIIAFADNYVTVLFNEHKIAKMFIYPSAFGEFLELKNDSFQSQIEVDKNWLAQELAKNQRIDAELMKITAPMTTGKIKAKPRKVVRRIY
jgi:hypothetical protein